MSKILVIAEHLDGKPDPSTARAVSAASAVKPDTLDILILPDTPDAITRSSARSRDDSHRTWPNHCRRAETPLTC